MREKTESKMQGVREKEKERERESERVLEEEKFKGSYKSV
jgi:hypothetical protein